MSHLSLVMRNPDFCICENKGADQLRGNREADQRLCFRYIDSTIPLLSKSEISSLYPFSVVAQLGLCRTRSETPKTGFLRTRLVFVPQKYQSRYCRCVCTNQNMRKTCTTDQIWDDNECACVCPQRKTTFCPHPSRFSDHLCK